MITVDLDEPTRLEIVMSWTRVDMYDPEGTTEGRVSSNGRGVHIRSRHVLPAVVPINERKRRLCLDDPKRIDGDKSGSLSRPQVLWDKKGNQHAGGWNKHIDGLVTEYQRAVPITERKEI